MQLSNCFLQSVENKMKSREGNIRKRFGTVMIRANNDKLVAIVKTQRNSTQLNPTLKQLALELDTVVTCSTPPHHHHPTTTNFPATSRPARELQFGTDTHCVGFWQLKQLNLVFD